MAALAAISTIASAQTKISIDSVSTHIGENVIVCSEVFGFKQSGKIAFINLGAAYPNSPLTVVIFAKDITYFKEAPASMYSSKKICVTDKLQDYKGKPQIIVSNPDETILQ
ncbi:MAG: hypothetical protein JWR61_4693 [Ferruginibacter sp.]|uniref:hypothetical protein n=1 Tax=Ferruginibacter sp. TaxID=1940288 RepID=UPI002659A6FC|nr:hypothetical protein [Ferruginibacter sp.]MDB5279738.1 hypothetical protein [Ferruginibacter sp.]